MCPFDIIVIIMCQQRSLSRPTIPADTWDECWLNIGLTLVLCLLDAQYRIIYLGILCQTKYFDALLIAMIIINTVTIHSAE